MSVAAHRRFNNDLRYRSGEHPNQTALTPEYVLDPVRIVLAGIDLDPCTTPDNPVGAARFYAPPVNGLSEPWDAASIFVNPPYGRARDPWVARCIEAARAGSRVALLIPAHTDTKTFQRALRSVTACVFIQGRVKFGVLRPNRRQVAASHPSALLFWNAEPWFACAHLGVVVRGGA